MYLVLYHLNNPGECRSEWYSDQPDYQSGLQMPQLFEKIPQNNIRVPHLVNDLLKDPFIPLDLFDPLRDVNNFQLVLGKHFVDIMDVLHRDARLALGAAIQNCDFHLAPYSITLKDADRSRSAG